MNTAESDAEKIERDRVFRAEMLNIGYMVLWWVIALMWSMILAEFGIHGENAFAACYGVAAVTSIVVSKGRREHVVSLARAARDRVVRFRRERADRRSRVVRAPVARLDRLARLFCSDKTYQRVFKPVRADVLHEWQLAEAAGDRRRVRVIRYFSGPWSMIQHMLAQVPVSIFTTIVKLLKAAK